MMASSSSVPTTAASQAEHPWACHICGQHLCRKQRLQTHLEKKHPGRYQDLAKQKRGPYKLYDIDDSVQVPKRTKIRHSQQPNSVPEGLDAETSIPSNDENDSEDDGEENDNGDEIEVPVRDKCMAIMSYIDKMKLSGIASEQLLRLLKVLGCDENIDKFASKGLKSVFSDIHPITIDYCAKCGAQYPEEDNVYICDTVDCGELRYAGAKHLQHQKRRKCYFSMVPVSQQIGEILERDGVLNKLGTHQITLTMNTDGVPLYNSSCVSLWPVFLIINELPPAERFLAQNLIIWGLWQGSGKPCFKTYLQPLVQELNHLCETGLDLNDCKVKAKLTCCTMDLQAKAQVMEMVQHNGEYGCISCENPGMVFKQGKGHCRGYPVNEAQPRSVDSILDNAEEAIITKVKAVRGVKSVSVLFGLQYFNPVAAVVPEYMHGVLLGVTKKLLSLWFSKSSSKKDFYLGNHIQAIDRRLLGMKPSSNISRLPRKLEGNLSHLKASELQHWLLYYSIPCVQGFLPQQFFDNLCYLVNGIFLLLADTLTNEEIDHAEMSLLKFHLSFQDLYGPENCGLNVHNLGCHLADYARIHGPLWAWSCFGFEDLNGFLIKSSHGTGDVSQQLLSALFSKKQLCAEAQLIKDNNLKDFTMDMLSSGRRIKSLKSCINCDIAGRSVPFKDDELSQKVARALSVQENAVVLRKVFRIRLRNGQLVSSSAYTRQKKRVCYAVLMSNGELGLVNHYIHEVSTNKCVAIVQQCEVVGLLNKNVGHLIQVKETVTDVIIPVENIVEQVLFLSGNDRAICMSRLPNFHGYCG